MIIEIKITSFPGKSMLRLLTSIKILTNLAKKFGFEIEVKKYSDVKYNIHRIEKIVYYGKEVKPESLKIRTRKTEICFSRQISMRYMLESGTEKAIGSYYDLNHATANHAKKTVEKLTEYSHKLRNAVERIDKRVKELK